MVRKKNREKVSLKHQATHSFFNINNIECFGLKSKDGFFALSPEHDKWVCIPEWAFNKYFG